ncbi:MAG TPA: hypothetical protein VF607_15320 [Verrucomicrobiae bacterium]
MKKLILFTGIALALSLAVQAQPTPPAPPAPHAAPPSVIPPVPDKLTTCAVSGEKLGDMGDAYVFTYKGQEVKLCCKSCKKKFDKDPETYLAKIRAADKPVQN